MEPTRDQKRSARKHAARAKTLRVLRVEPAAPDELAELEQARPHTRAECEHGIRPCPFVACKYHLYLEVTEGGRVRLNFPDLEPWEMPVSCVLDVADTDGVEMEGVGEFANITREGVRLMLLDVLTRLRKRMQTMSDYI